MYAKGQREAIIFGYALALAALVCAVGYMLSSGGCGRTGTRTDTARGNGERATEQVKRAAELNELAREENKSAGAAVERAADDAQRAAEFNQRAQEQLADSKKLLSEIRADNRRAKQILDELIGEHQAGKAQDGAR